MKKYLSVVAIFMFYSSYAFANSPEQIAKSYFELLKTQQWIEIAHLYDPEALSGFREMMGFLLEVPDEVATQVLGAFFGAGTTKGQVRAMPDNIFFANFMRSTMARAAQLGKLNFKKIDILGSIKEGNNQVHVVTRTQVVIGDMDMESMEVISFKKVGNEWRILLQGKTKGMAQQIKKALQQRQ